MLFRALRRLPQQRFLLGRFRTAVKDGRLAAAAAAGERLLDLVPTAAAYEELVRPVDRDDAPTAHLHCYDLLQTLEQGPSAASDPWPSFFRVCLLARLGWYAEALRASASFVDLPERYGWMRYVRAMLLLNNVQAYDDASRELEATLRSVPSFWKARGMLAECALCLGREDEAFGLMDACAASAESTAERNEATTWRGELHLWLGQYADACASLAPGIASGSPYALIWGGGAHLLAGEHDRAVALLERAAQAAPRDAEAYVWRGEAYERLGQPERALADFDRALAATGTVVWPVVGRALARARTGDAAGAMADFTTLPAHVRALFEWKTGRRVDGDLDAAVAVMLAMRTAARGLRRSEQYLEPLWLKRT